ncbi:MAG: cobalamin biosynthesis protein CbiX [Opitutae bacterium]|nr:cobalamin biosynthesis protein CbiX [Opitutae bacterium]
MIRLVNGKSLENPIYLLADNGSLEAQVTLSLRKSAHIVSLLAGVDVHPVSLLHSSKVDPQLLDGIKAETMEDFLAGPIGQSSDDLRILPFFFGPSRALTEWLPEKLEHWKSERDGRSHRILDCLHQPGDTRLAVALEDLCLRAINRNELKKPFLALVDHGTPAFDVHRVREEVGEELKERMKNYVSGFSTCSMECRDGEEYDFNEPLLENLLAEKKEEYEEMLVAQLFLSPGRHAGAGGDLDRICSSFADSSPSHRLVRTDLLGTHPSVLEILLERIERDQSSG